MGIIRELGAADATAFQALRLQALLECPLAFSSSHEEERDLPLAVVAQRLAPEANGCMIGAWQEDRLVGTVGLGRETVLKLAHKAFIWGVYVAPEARQGGLGKQLMAAALARAAAMPGLRQVNLSVHAHNLGAIRLYEAMGFEAFGLERGYLLLNGVLHDEIHMARTLQAPPTP